MAKLVWKRQEGRCEAQTSVQKWWAKSVLTIKSTNPEILEAELWHKFHSPPKSMVFFPSIL
jgi:hypothetical protein